MGKLDRAPQSFNESFNVFNTDVEILLFPVMSGISAVMVGAGFFFPLCRGGVFQSIHMGQAFWQDYAALFA
jgi:hypothetical protein